MNPLDILILAVLAVGAVLGFRRGIVAQVGQIAAIVAGIVLSRTMGPRLSAVFAGSSGDVSAFDYVCGYLAVFLIGYGVVLLLARLIRGTVHGLCLGIIDRLAGAVFKAAQWLLLLSIALNLYFMVSGGEGELRHPSKPWRAAAIDFAPAVLGYLARIDNPGPADDVKNNHGKE